MREHSYKDQILKLLLPDNTGNYPMLTADKLIDDIRVNISYLIYLLDELGEANLIVVKKTSGVSNPLSGRLCHIEHKGIAFINRGGFTKIAKNELLLRCWIVAKTVALTLNSLLILGVAIWGVRVQIEANTIKVDNSKSIIKNNDRTQRIKKADTLIVQKKHK